VATVTSTGLWTVADQSALVRGQPVYGQTQAPIPASTPVQQGLLRWLAPATTTVPNAAVVTRAPVIP
jgi:hypothetical protein